MKIQLFIITFLLFLSSISAQTFSVVKGSVYSVSTKNIVLEQSEGSKDGDMFNSGKELHLTKRWGISATKETSRSHIYFSNKMHMWAGGKTTIWLDNFEQFIDKDEVGKILIDDGSFICNIRLNGSIDVKLKKISETGYFSIMTNSADLNIKSNYFYISTDGGNLTEVDCYDGSIVLTNSIDFKETILISGNHASIFGNAGGMNLIITISPLTDEQKKKASSRLTEENFVEWKFTH